MADVRVPVVLALVVSLPGAALAQEGEARPFEVSAGLLAGQVNGPALVQHIGAEVRLAWRPRPGVALVLRGLWTTSAVQEPPYFSSVYRDRTLSVGPTLQRWGLLAGTDITLGRGTLSLGAQEAPFEVVVPAALGAGRFAVALKPENKLSDGTLSPATFGDAGWRLVGTVGLALRTVLAGRFVLRLEVSDTISSTRVSAVNGCDVDDLRTMDIALRMGQSPDQVPRDTLSRTCQVAAFSGVDPKTQLRRSNDIPLALNQVRVPSSRLQHLLAAQLSLGVTF